MDKKINNFDFDFMPIGQAIKKAREAKKVTREQLAEIVDYSARHIQSVENEGQHPSFEVLLNSFAVIGGKMNNRRVLTCVLKMDRVFLLIQHIGGIG